MTSLDRFLAEKGSPVGVQSIAEADAERILSPPKAKPRQPDSADSLPEFCDLFRLKHNRTATAREQDDWLPSHPEQAERDHPGFKRRSAELRRKALSPEFVKAKGTMRKTRGGDK